MRWWFFLLGVFWLLTGPPVGAQNVYVNDVVQVTLRTGPGYDHKILSVLQSGDAVTVLDEGEEWSRVRSADGAEGWLLSRLLTDKEPNVRVLRRLERRLADIEGGADEQSNRLRQEKRDLENALTETRFELEAARQAHDNLKSEAGEVIETRRALSRTKARLQAQAETLERCRRKLVEQDRAERLRWFLSGAGVLLLGILIGLGIGRRRRTRLL